MQLSLLRQLMRIYKDRSLNLKKRVDVNFIGKQGADMGGPTNEFFHSAISCLSKVDPAFNVQLFGGQPGHLTPLYGVDAIASGCFEMAGKLIAHSILHGGPGFSGLAPAIVQYLCTGSLDKSKHLVTIEDLYDLGLKEILEEHVSNSNSHHFRGSFLLCSKLLLVNNLFDGFMIFTCTYIISKTNKGNFYIKGYAPGLTLKWCKKKSELTFVSFTSFLVGVNTLATSGLGVCDTVLEI